MDNLTHSLTGALIGQTGLKRKTGLGMAALVIGANIPDIDAVCTLYGIESLRYRRGFTHGPLAMAVLPVVLTFLLIAYDRWRPRATRLPVRPGWLYLLALIGTLSHPALDWLNSYGIRLLAPFSQRWFYGDTLFIIDLWLWLIMGLGLFMSIRRERRGRIDWPRPARIAFDTACAYVFVNGVITGYAERLAIAALAQRGVTATVVANPTPLTFWRREMLWRNEARHGSGQFSLGQGVALSPGAEANGLEKLGMSNGRVRGSDAAAFLFWSRMPVAREEDGRIRLSDQRFDNPIVRDRFTVDVPQ